MEKIGSIFEDYKIILYYDHSDDDTILKMRNYQKLNPRLIIYVNDSKMLPYRTHRIALGRNTCLNIIRENFSDYEYFIMMDCDDRCVKDMNMNLLMYYLMRNNWDSLSFNHPDGYYDTWALSKIPFVASCHHFRDNGMGARYLKSIMKRTPKNALIPCLSAFNGFAIYRTNKFLNCYYDGRFRLDYIPKKLLRLNMRKAGRMIFSQNKEDCEHRFFHFSAIYKNNARIRISPLCFFK